MNHSKTKSYNRIFALIFFAYLLSACFIALRNLNAPWGDLFGVGGNYSHYNNFIIFRNSFFHLLDHRDLYIHYPLEQYDLFKYTPTFALFMAPFALLPSGLGYFFWTLANLFLPIYAFFQIGKLDPKLKIVGAALLLLESYTSALNSQSNGLMLGLLLMSFAALERSQFIRAAFFISITVYIKLFGVLFFVLFLIYPGSIKKSLLPTILTLLVLFCLPMLVMGWGELLNEYGSMLNLLANDRSTYVKYSVMGWFNQWFALAIDKNTILMMGLLLQMLPLSLLFWDRFRKNFYLSESRYLYAASWLIWMVIFNHMAESATYVIAVGGAIILLFSNQWRRESANKFYYIGFILLLLFTILGPTDIYPKSMRFWIIETAQLKAFPCIYLWALILYELFRSVRIGFSGTTKTP